jgi:hypothetical protein
VSLSPHLKTKTDPVSETLCFLDILNSGQWEKSINPVFLTSEQTRRNIKIEYVNETGSNLTEGLDNNNRLRYPSSFVITSAYYSFLLLHEKVINTINTLIIAACL